FLLSLRPPSSTLFPYTTLYRSFIEVASTNAAKLFDLYPKKGTIAVGADADLVIYDAGYRGSISAETHKMNVDYSAFEGFEIDGRSEEHTSELQSRENLVCRLLL